MYLKNSSTDNRGIAEAPVKNLKKLWQFFCFCAICRTISIRAFALTKSFSLMQR